MGRVLQELGSRQNIRALAISMATAGLTEGFLQGLEGLQADPAALTQTGSVASQTGAAMSELGTAASQTGSIASQATTVSQTVASQATSLLENIESFAAQTFSLSNVRDTLQRSAATAGVTAGIATLTGDLSPGEALVQGARTAAATVFQTAVAQATGDAYSKGTMGFIEHKGAHFLGATVAGIIQSNEPVSGAIGGVAASTITKILPTTLSPENRANIGRAAAAIAATVTGQDVNLAIHTGTIAAASSLAPEPLTFLLGEPVGEGNALTPSQRTIQGVLAAGGDEGDAALIVTNPLFQDILSQGQAMTGGVITINLPPLPGIRANETSYSAPQVQHHKLVQIFLDASNFVADVHRENPRMAELAVAGLQVALTGPWSMLKSMAQEYVLGNTIEVFKGAASQFVANKLNIAQEYAELATNGAFMGVCFVFGNSKQVVKVAEDVQKSVGKNSKFYMTYYKEHPNKKPYWGITSGKGDITNQRDLDRALKKRDRNHHMNEQGFGDAIFDRASKNPAPIRGREQLKIEQTGGAQSKGGNSSNKNNSIRDGNPKKDHYIGEARKEFGDQ